MNRFIKQLFCWHNYINIQRLQPKPFNHIAYPLSDKDGYWLYDIEPFRCSKCDNITWKKVKE